MEDPKDKFYTFKERLEAKYGAQKAGLVIASSTT